MYLWSMTQLYSILPLQTTAKITFLIFIKENMMKIMCQCAFTECVKNYKHSVSGHGYKDYKSMSRQMLL